MNIGPKAGWPSPVALPSWSAQRTTRDRPRASGADSRRTRQPCRRRQVDDHRRQRDDLDRRPSGRQRVGHPPVRHQPHKKDAQHRSSTRRATSKTVALRRGPVAGGENPANDDETDHLDLNGRQDPPVAVDDSVTARAGSTVTIPVTGNDYDPDGDAIAVLASVTREGRPTARPTCSTAPRWPTSPELGYSGSDSFDYTIVDEHGNTDKANVNVELFPPGSPNRPPIARPDKVTTRLDVLSPSTCSPTTSTPSATC